MTPYESNVNSLFTSFVDSASISNFNKFEISHLELPQSDVVYGLFQCQGDLSSSNCKDCVANSVSQLKTACPFSTSGGIQLDGCFVKYDNSSFFGTEDNIEVLKRCGPSVGYNSDVLNQIDGALAFLISGNGGKYFREGDFGSVQGMAQCVQDLSLSDCQDCLSEACGRLRSECETSTWGDMFLGKCYMRYVDQGNDGHAYNGNSSSNKRSGGGSNNNIVKWIGYIIAAAVGGVGLTFAAKNCCNINVYNKVKKIERELEGAKKGVESAKTEAKEANTKADEAKADVADKKAKDAQKEAQQAKMYVPMLMPMPMPNCQCQCQCQCPCQNPDPCSIM